MAEQKSESQTCDHDVPTTWQRLRIDTAGMMPFSDPAGRLVMGLVIAVLAGMVVFVPTLERARAWMTFFALFGVAMIASACMQFASNKRFRRGMQRAEGEWSDLNQVAVQAAQNGTPLTRMLKQRGYRDYFVRRWLVQLLTEDLPRRTGEDLRAAHVVAQPSDAAPDDRTWLQLRDRSALMLPIANPVIRIVFGLLMAVGAIGFRGMNGVVFQWMILFIGLGGAMVISGLAQLRRDHIVRRELQRARLQWQELQMVAQVAMQTGGSMARELTNRGYREYFVRRWIIARLQPVAGVHPD